MDFGYTVTLQIKGPWPTSPSKTPQKRKLPSSYVKKHTKLSSMLHFELSTYKDASPPYPYTLDTSKTSVSS